MATKTTWADRRRFVAGKLRALRAAPPPRWAPLQVVVPVLGAVAVTYTIVTLRVWGQSDTASGVRGGTLLAALGVLFVSTAALVRHLAGRRTGTDR